VLFSLIATGIGSGALFWQPTETEETKTDVSYELALVGRRSMPEADVSQTASPVACCCPRSPNGAKTQAPVLPEGTGHRLPNGLSAPLRL